MIKILVMGLPGSGKSFLSEKLSNELSRHGKCTWLNADRVRADANDWDFTVEGRIRQGDRMASMANNSDSDFVVLDFIAPLAEIRDRVEPDWIVWMDTIRSSKYPDTNFVFQNPKEYDFHIVEKSQKPWAQIICDSIISGERKKFDGKKPTVQMLGRFQPWHDGHRALFERAFAKTGQVAIMVRDSFDGTLKNPFKFDEIEGMIKSSLDEQYQGRFEVIKVPNIVNITYGRDVGYDIEKESFDPMIEAISGTNIREEIKNGGYH